VGVGFWNSFDTITAVFVPRGFVRNKLIDPVIMNDEVDLDVGKLWNFNSVTFCLILWHNCRAGELFQRFE
jgi:hypothetical protein